MEISCWTVYPEDPLLLEYEFNDVNWGLEGTAGSCG